MYCNSCGTSIENPDKFCHSCGTALHLPAEESVLIESNETNMLLTELLKREKRKKLIFSILLFPIKVALMPIVIILTFIQFVISLISTIGTALMIISAGLTAIGLMLALWHLFTTGDWGPTVYCLGIGGACMLCTGLFLVLPVPLLALNGKLICFILPRRSEQ